MCADTETLIVILNDRLKDMNPDERIEVINSVFYGYCHHCGGIEKENEMPCQCWNDD